MLALHVLQSALVHVNTLLLQQVLAEPKWAKKLSAEDRRGLTALFWSNVNPYGTFRLDMHKRLDLALSAAVPRPRTPAGGPSPRSAPARPDRPLTRPGAPAMSRTRVRPLGHCSRCTRACWKDVDDAPRWNTEFDKGLPVGLLCPDCQTPEENAEAEVKAATLDYAHTAPDSEGRQKVTPLGGWHTVTAMGHPLVREDRTVHLALAIESMELRVAVGPQSDARLHELFDGPCATVVRAALGQEQARPGQRAITYNPMADLGPDTVLLIEDHALCADGEDRGELMLSFSPSLNPHLLSAFAPPVAEAVRQVLAAAHEG